MGLSREIISPSKSSGPLFLKYLKNNGKVKHAMFAMLLTDSTRNSSIEIGKYSIEHVREPSKLYWFTNLGYQTEWQVQITAYKVGESGTVNN